jgi:SH3 domain (SH3b1 type)/NlpC/P60 family/NLPC_P60 stabilising domain, N term
MKTIFCIPFWSFVVADNANLSEKLHEIVPQDCADFIQDVHQADQPLVVYDATQVMESFLTYYFSPWENPCLSFSPEELCEQEKNRVEKCFQNPGWDLNKRPHTTDLITAISNNMMLATFPNLQQPAVVIRTTDLRSFPCSNPAFSSPEEIPFFDDWQESLLAPNEPLHVLHTSQDRAWSFVVTGSHTCGWVQRDAIAYTTPEFIAQWKTERYVTPLCDDVPVVGNTLAPLARVGQLIPLAQQQSSTDNYSVLTIVTTLEGYAAIKVSTICKKNTTVMPLLATPNNMARMANSLMGQPYGWGGADGYRDCSATLKDLFVPFGIWLPRNSSAQLKAGTFVSLEGLKDDQKEKVIREQGVPFFSLVYKPGHIMLYLGEKKGKVYVYNNLWILRTHSPTGTAGKAIMEKTVIMPLELGKEYSNITYSLLDESKGLILLHNRLLKPHSELSLLKK